MMRNATLHYALFANYNRLYNMHQFRLSVTDKLKFFLTKVPSIGVEVEVEKKSNSTPVWTGLL